MQGDLRKFISLLIGILKNRKERVILNSQSSSWAEINPGASKGSILCPLLFLHLFDNHQCNPKLFADDLSLFPTVNTL